MIVPAEQYLHRVGETMYSYASECLQMQILHYLFIKAVFHNSPAKEDKHLSYFASDPFLTSEVEQQTLDSIFSCIFLKSDSSTRTPGSVLPENKRGQSIFERQ